MAKGSSSNSHEGNSHKGGGGWCSPIRRMKKRSVDSEIERRSRTSTSTAIADTLLNDSGRAEAERCERNFLSMTHVIHPQSRIEGMYTQ